MSQNKRTVETYIAAFEKGDAEKVLSCLTEDVVWDLPGAFHLEGKEAFSKEIRNDGFRGNPVISTSRMIGQDDIVVAEGTVRTQTREGKPVHLAFCDVFEMREEKIQRLTSYLMEIRAH
jgi:ketosteroid isomerase-like protein